MSQSGVQTLVDRWLNDQAFRGALRANPEAAIRATGVDLSDDEWAAVRTVGWDASDSELESRFNKNAGC